MTSELEAQLESYAEGLGVKVIACWDAERCTLLAQGPRGCHALLHVPLPVGQDELITRGRAVIRSVLPLTRWEALRGEEVI